MLASLVLLQVSKSSYAVVAFREVAIVILMETTRFDCVRTDACVYPQMLFDRKVPGNHVTRQSSAFKNDTKHQPRFEKLRKANNVSLMTKKCKTQQLTYIYVGEGLCVRNGKYYVVQQTFNLGHHYRMVISAVPCFTTAIDLSH